MKKRIIQSLLAIACCVMVALNAIPTAEAAMRASVVTGWNAYSKLDSPFRTGQCCRHFLLS